MTTVMLYAFVIDNDNKKLSPTKIQKAWYKIRNKQATLISKYPMVIRLNKQIKLEQICKDEVRLGIDDGGLHVGLGIVQKCKRKNKVLFKGTIEQRNDVKKKMTIRRNYRRYRRYHKRYRKARFNNRINSKRKNRIAPSILQKRQATIRVINNLLKYIRIDKYYLEDVAIDIRALTDGYKPYKWHYQVSNRLDENIRKAVILRDNLRCMECGKSDCKLEVHHIKARRYNGANTLNNLITLCSKCHQRTKGQEEKFEKHYNELLKGKTSPNLNYAMHVMIGKTWLRTELLKLGELILTTGGDTANKRIEWNIKKSHSNDALCITDLEINSIDCEIKDWLIKPLRKKSKAKIDNVLGIKHRDYVEYTYKNGETHRGYVTALYPEQLALNFQSLTKHCKKVNARKCKLLWKFNTIYWV